jgi:tetratricopeptide (TPR) repeat protein
MPKVSACLIVKDEAACLAGCLRSVRGVVDEIIVIDTGSTDETVEIARAEGAKVARITWRGDFAAARNAALDQATGDWIFVLDADEELDDTSASAVRTAVSDPAAEAYWVRIVSYLGDSPDDQLTVENLYPRLFRRRLAYRFAGDIHEQILPALTSAGAEVRTSAITLLHYGYLVPVVTSRGKIARNITMLEGALKKHPHDPYHWFNLGTEHLRDRRPADAERAFRKSLKLLGTKAPRYLSVIVRNLTLALRDQRKDKETLELLRQYQTRFPDYTDLHYFEGLVRADLFDWDGVETVMRRALTLGEAPSDDYLVLRGAGTTLPLVWIAIAKMERGEDAVLALQTAADAVPHDPNVLEHLVRRSCKSEGVAATLERVRPIAKSGRVAARRVARAFAKAGAYQAALDVLSPEDDADGFVTLFRGECLFRLGRLEEAYEVLGGVPRNNAAVLPALLRRIQTALVMGDMGRARAMLVEAQRAQPHGLDAVFRTFDAMLAVCEETSRLVEIPDADRQIAIPIIRNVIRSALSCGATPLASSLSLLLRLAGQSDGEAFCLMGKLAYLEQQYTVAGQFLGRAFALRGLDPEGCVIAADLHRLAQNFDDALTLYQAFVATRARGAMSMYLEAASVALKLRRLDDALMFLDAGLTVYPSATLLGKARVKIAAIRQADVRLPASERVAVQA